MEYVIQELRGVSNKLGQLQMRLERKGTSLIVSELQVAERLKETRSMVDDLRCCLEENRRSPNQVLVVEIANAIDEIVESTGKPLSEVLEQANEIYKTHIEEVRDIERRKRQLNDLFKGW